MICNDILYLSTFTPAVYWNEDLAFTPTGVPTITDVDFDGSGTYTYAVSPQFGATSVSNITATGSGGSTSFNSTTRTLTITGTRTQVNSYLSNIVITPTADYAATFFINYSVVTPRGGTATATKAQQAIIANIDVEISNIVGTRRYYTPSQFITNFPFSNTTYYTAQTQATGTFSRFAETNVSGNTVANAAYLVTDGLQEWNQDGWVGSAVPYAEVPKSGTAALQVGNLNPSRGDYVRFTPGSNVTLTGDFTIEGWFLSRQTDQEIGGTQSPAVVSMGPIFDTHSASADGTTGFAILAAADGTAVYEEDGSYTVGSPRFGILVVGRNTQLKFRANNVNWRQATWYHIAVSRQGSTCRVFVNGSNVGSFADTGDLVLPTTGLGVGSGFGSIKPQGAAYPESSNSRWLLTGGGFRGYIDNFVISNTARYTNNFAAGFVQRDQNTVYYFNMDGSNGQWPPSSQSYGGLPTVFTQTTPQITDTDTGANYTIRFSCASSLGAFSYAGSTPTNNFTFSGTRAQCNQVFANLRFHPVSTVGGNVTYTQEKNAVTQVTQTILFQGIVSATPY
jgi:hypothetical protein